MQCLSFGFEHSGTKEGDGDICAENKWGVPGATPTPLLNELLFKKNSKI